MTLSAWRRPSETMWPMARGSSTVSRCVTFASMKSFAGKCIRKPSCRTRPYAPPFFESRSWTSVMTRSLTAVVVVAFDEKVERAVHRRERFSHLEASFVGEAGVTRGIDIALSRHAESAEPCRELRWTTRRFSTTTPVSTAPSKA
mgnify:CR=1 FL=1